MLQKLRWVVLCGLIAMATDVCALDPCILVYPDVSFSPGHPSTSDSISYRIDSPYYLTYWTALSMWTRATVTGNDITLSLVASIERTDVPGYQPVRNAMLPHNGFAGTLGPLPLGTYTVHATTGQYYASTDQFVPTWPNGCTDPVRTLQVGMESGAVRTVAVVEFYNSKLDHYFITASSAEIADLDNGIHTGWARTGQQFLAYSPGQADGRGSPVCRYYAPAAPIESHFFSASTSECSSIASSYGSVWFKETDDAFDISVPETPSGICPANTVSVFRLWNGRIDSNHRYTTDPVIKRTMVMTGYIPEGYGPDAVVMCAPL
jgi:hypothetical protein